MSGPRHVSLDIRFPAIDIPGIRFLQLVCPISIGHITVLLSGLHRVFLRGIAQRAAVHSRHVHGLSLPVHGRPVHNTII